MKMRHVFLKAVCVGAFAMLLSAGTVKADQTVRMYRLYNPNSGEHFYTSSEGERNHLVSVGWNYEGGAWTAPTTGAPVYRLYNPNAGDHHYTTSKMERDHLVSVGWKYENIGWYSGGKAPVYRLYNPNAQQAGAHHYTLNKVEYNDLITKGWSGENVGWYAVGSFAAEDVSEITEMHRPKSQQELNVQDNDAPRRVDENITTAGGGEGNNPGSYRLLYSNKPFDHIDGKKGKPFLEFSADMVMTGEQSPNNDYGMQFIIAGNGPQSGQIGLDVGYQSGTSEAFAQNRIAVKTVNFPAGSGVTGQQYYSVNTKMPNTGRASISVKYYKNGGKEYVETYYNGQLAGRYKTKLTTSGSYILHAQIGDNNKKKTAILKLKNIKVLQNGRDITDEGAVKLCIADRLDRTGRQFTLISNTNEWLIQGAY